MTERQWRRLSRRRKAEHIIELMDEARMATEGGYPSQYVIKGSMIYMASVSYCDAPELTVAPLIKFIDDNECWVTDWFDD